MPMRIFGKLVIAGVVVFAGLQVVRPSIPKPATAELQAPREVRQIFEKSCYSCHSDQRRLSWFDQIVPGYWLVRHDILTAREHLNFSTLGSSPPAMQKAALYEAANMIQLGAMPLPSFLLLHPEAKVSAEELTALKEYLAPWAPTPDRHDTTPGISPAETDAVPVPSSLSTGSTRV
jgi:mono/diheme cytochrome c family protein